MPPCLSRPEICELTGFNSWTAIQAWLLDVVDPAFQALIDGYLRWHERRGEKTNHGPDGTKEHFIRNAQSFEREVARRVAEIRTGNPPRIPRPAREYQLSLATTSDIVLQTDRGFFFTAENRRAHYENFVVEALALDRIALADPHSTGTQHISDKGWAHVPETLFANMYELTDAICYNYWCVVANGRGCISGYGVD